MYGDGFLEIRVMRCFSFFHIWICGMTWDCYSCFISITLPNRLNVKCSILRVCFRRCVFAELSSQSSTPRLPAFSAVAKIGYIRGACVLARSAHHQHRAWSSALPFDTSILLRTTFGFSSVLHVLRTHLGQCTAPKISSSTIWRVLL